MRVERDPGMSRHLSKLLMAIPSSMPVTGLGHGSGHKAQKEVFKEASVEVFLSIE